MKKVILLMACLGIVCCATGCFMTKKPVDAPINESVQKETGISQDTDKVVKNSESAESSTESKLNEDNRVKDEAFYSEEFKSNALATVEMDNGVIWVTNHKEISGGLLPQKLLKNYNIDIVPTIQEDVLSQLDADWVESDNIKDDDFWSIIHKADLDEKGDKFFDCETVLTEACIGTSVCLNWSDSIENSYIDKYISFVKTLINYDLNKDTNFMKAVNKGINNNLIDMTIELPTDDELSDCEVTFYYDGYDGYIKCEYVYFKG